MMRRIRYGVTCIHKDGERKLISAKQAQHLWDTPAQAEAWLKACNDQPDNLDRWRQIFGPQSIGTFQVDAFECYDHGDPISWWPVEEGRADG